MSAERDRPRPDFEAEGLLDGVQGGAHTARLRLLNRLFDAGIGLDELKQAAAQDRLVILPAEHALGGDARLSARALSREVDMPLDYFLAVRRAHGLSAGDPDELLYSEQDVEPARRMAEFYNAGFDRAGMLEAARVLGRGMAQFADSLGALFGETFIKAGMNEDELALLNASAAAEVLPRVTPVIEYTLREHMRERLRHQAVSQAMLEAGELPGAREIAVAFADLVAFTRLGEHLAPEDVGDIAGRLGEVASECARAPVRMVKTIGDAAMLVAPEATALMESTLELVEKVESIEGLPRLRAGAAFGPALSRSGDWYGRPVNLASRVTDVAEPGTVVGTAELRDATGDFYLWTSVGSHRLKGIDGDVELFRAEHDA